MAAGTAGTQKEAGKAAITRLEGAVDRLLAELEDARSGVAALTSIQSGSEAGEDPQALALRIKALEGENRDLRERLASGRGIAERLVAKIRFLEEKK